MAEACWWIKTKVLPSSFCIIISIGIEQDDGLQTLYNGLNGKIERMCKWLYIAMIKVSIAGTMLPPLLITLVNYYIYDLGDESIQDIQMMYVVFSKKFENVIRSFLFLLLVCHSVRKHYRDI